MTREMYHREPGVAHPLGAMPKELGITAVELLPVFAFDEQGTPSLSSLDGQPFLSGWGYDPVAHFAPHPAYCLAPEKGSHQREFREMVKALHQAGIDNCIADLRR